MRLFELITIIAITAIIAGLIKELLKKRKAPPVDLSHLENRLENLEKLEERVNVLEAIVTDKGYALKRDIDNLR